MSLFQYKATDTSGKTVEGAVEASDRFEFYHGMKQEGLMVVSAKETKTEKKFSLVNLSSFLTLFSGVSTHEKIIFARNLSKMLDSGLPVTRGLTILERQSRGGLREIIVSLNSSISKGKTLSDGMKNYPNVFSSLFTSMVRAGEESGNLSAALQSVSMQMEKTYQLNRKIRGALMYPAVIICLMLVIGVLMMVYMVPTLTATFSGMNVDLPLSTRTIIATSDFLQNHFLLAFFLIASVVVLFVYFFRTVFGKRVADTLLLKMPVIGGVVQQVNSARTARTLSSLLSSGVDIVVAIGVTRDVLQNSHYKKVLDEAQKVIQKGEPISKVFENNPLLYPLFVGEMISVGEESGKIGEMLASVATFYEDEVDQKTKDISSLVEPFLMIFIGIAVGFFALAVIGPIYSLGDSIK